MDANKIFRIGVDARLAGEKHAGIGRYAENLIKQLIKFSLNTNNPTTKLVLFFFDSRQAKEVLGDFFTNKKIEVVISEIKHYGLEEQLFLPKFYKQANLDLLYVPHWNVPLAYKGKLIITIHDLLWHEQKGTQVTTLKPWKYLIKHLAYKLVSRATIKKAQAIFVPAQTIKETVLKYYPKAESKIVVSKEGVADIYEKVAEEKNSVAKKIKKQIIYTGSLYPHKNLKIVIKSLKKLPKYKLLIASSRSVFQDQIQALISKYKVKSQVTLLGFIPDEKLIGIYQESMALVQPSLSEGFGLTGIEAMSCQLPVLASDIKIFREIYQDAAFFFDPQSSANFIQALENLESSNRKKTTQLGLKIANQYSFTKMSKDIWQEFLKQL